jgi:hypothetical protein
MGECALRETAATARQGPRPARTSAAPPPAAAFPPESEP